MYMYMYIYYILYTCACVCRTASCSISNLHSSGQRPLFSFCLSFLQHAQTVAKSGAAPEAQGDHLH